MTCNNWGDNDPIKGNDCSVLSGSLWKSKGCDSKEHFVCVCKSCQGGKLMQIIVLCL